ncbi:MAG: hypothetical protein RIC19_22850 [Phaeodactylibacter sp.]|uniref:hypothetical protein n=1 Tax=Phaeodactylibacter sp. TaxID=1940289 RepID=UPI0032F08312
MALYQSTYHSKIFRDFKEIDAANYRRIIHFYEAREDTIRGLDFEEYFEMLIAYVNSLFEVGFHQKHLLMVDVAIEEVIVHNVESLPGENLYEQLLFRKAASHFQCLQYEKCHYVLMQLIRIDPYNTDAISFLKKCLRRMEPVFLERAKATAIFLFLLAALVIAIEVLLVRPFYEMHADLIERSRNTIFGIGCLSLVGGLLWHRYRVEQRVEQMVQLIRREKQLL